MSFSKNSVCKQKYLVTVLVKSKNGSYTHLKFLRFNWIIAGKICSIQEKVILYFGKIREISKNFEERQKYV
jgi:hypothetical protein